MRGTGACCEFLCNLFLIIGPYQLFLFTPRAAASRVARGGRQFQDRTGKTSKVTSLAVNGCPDDRLTYPNVWFPSPFGIFDPTKAPEMTGSWYYTVCGDPVWTELGECKWRLDAKLAKGHTVENGLKEGLEEECKNNFAWDHVIIDGTPGHYQLYSNDHGKFVLDDMFPDWN